MVATGVSLSQRTHPFILIEGIDGAGKGSHAKQLVEGFLAQKTQAFYRHFPDYENLTGQAIARHLNRGWSATSSGSGLRDPVDELVFQCLQVANRYESANSLNELLRQGVVVCDRYIPSGLVYGKINGLPPQFLNAIHEALPQPDVCILIDVPVSETAKRRSRKLDRYEEQQDMQEAARTEYLRLFRQNQWHVVDGTGSFEEVHSRVVGCIPSALLF